MNSKPARLGLMIGLLVGCVLFLRGVVCAQTTTFTYQGKLTEGSSPANGSYDFQFALFDNLATGTGTQIGSTLTRAGTNVVGGIFTVQLDFSIHAFPGANRFLEISVRPASVGSFTILSPRQQISSTPYAIRTLSAATADTATNSTQLGGVAASQYVQTNDSRLSDSRSPTPGSANYIQNTTTQQSANFNISGNGRISGNVSIGTTASPAAKLDVREPVDGIGVYARVGTRPSLAQEGGVGVNGECRDCFAGVAGASDTGVGVKGISSSNVGVFGLSNSGLGVFGQTTSGASVKALGGNAGSIALLANGSSWFRGDTTPLSASQTGPGEGIVIGSVGGYGYIAAWDYGVFQSRNLVLNREGGNVGINTSAPTLPLDVNGRARIRDIPNLGGTIGTVCFNGFGDLLQCTASSLKWKTNIRPFRSGLDTVLRLRPINFNWKEDGRADFGLGAEDVAKVAPELTVINVKGEAEGVKYEKLNLLLINAVKEQQKQIDQMRVANANLTARLRAVEKRLRTRGSHRR